MSSNDQASPVWRKSSFSNGERNCVEVADVPGATLMRDSKNPEAGHLSFTFAEWGMFIEDVKSTGV
ncbi:DUF397 domain-containing protein [Nocardiopsis sp. FR4]|uniref:DUF397 domain-containing protein n=1 Tax=Nocardiopsis sp. FR4 TaxID=2605985 RepID=UPI001F2C085E|nr:DUF397 domain-containing protein [Nocardiopsis sp. FR4]